MHNRESGGRHEQFLDNEQAQTEANMIRSQMGQDPQTGLINVEKAPTAKDYDDALKVVEEMKEAAEAEPQLEKAIEMVSRFINKSVLAVAIVAETIEANLTKDPTSQRALRDAQNQWHSFEDAAYKIRKLKKQAESFGRTQSNAEKSQQ